MLAQEDGDKNERVVFYLSKRFHNYETRDTSIPWAQNQFTDALATLASMVEIPDWVWTWPLEIEQSYQLVHKEKGDLSTLAIEEDGVPWYYDVMKFLELGIYPNGASKKECRSVRMIDVHEIYTIKYPHICLFSLIFYVNLWLIIIHLCFVGYKGFIC